MEKIRNFWKFVIRDGAIAFMNRMNLKITADEFMAMAPPGAKRSKMAPFWTEIKLLRSQNYSLDQVKNFLSENGIEITTSALWKYIKRTEQKEQANTNITQIPNPEPIDSTGIENEKHVVSETNRPWNSMDFAGLSSKQKRELKADRFIKNSAEYSLVQRLKGKK